MGSKYDIGKVRAENVAIGDHATAEYGMKRLRASRGCMREHRNKRVRAWLSACS